MSIRRDRSTNQAYAARWRPNLPLKLDQNRKNLYMIDVDSEWDRYRIQTNALKLKVGDK
jgi:hypothetical protein